jgi:hypothetical protein
VLWCALLQDEPVCEGEVLLSFENKSPIQDTFQFQRISGGLTRWGWRMMVTQASNDPYVALHNYTCSHCSMIDGALGAGCIQGLCTCSRPYEVACVCKG